MPSHSWQDPQSQEDPFVNSSQEDNILQEEDLEVISEVARIIEDLENSIVDPTLTRFGAEDVALDIDDIFAHEDDNWSDSSSEGSVDGIEEEEWTMYVVANRDFNEFSLSQTWQSVTLLKVIRCSQLLPWDEGIVWPPGESATSLGAINPKACCTCFHHSLMGHKATWERSWGYSAKPISSSETLLTQQLT